MNDYLFGILKKSILFIEFSKKKLQVYKPDSVFARGELLSFIYVFIHIKTLSAYPSCFYEVKMNE